MTEMPRMPDIWFLYGLSGSGKTFVGNIIAAETGWDIYHADDDITPAMREALRMSQPFTPVMREEYFALLVYKIRERKRPGQPLLVTQGAYKRCNRVFLQKQIPGLALLWIDAPENRVQDRLRKRHDGISADSAAALLRDFEAPVEGPRIVNDGDASRVLAQFRTCLSGYRKSPESCG